jgi:hypothetical protein
VRFSGALAGRMELVLEVLLTYLHVAECHGNIFVPQQLH